MKDENKNNSKILPSSTKKINHRHIKRMPNHNLISEKKDNQIKKEFSETVENKNKEKIINGKNSKDSLQSPFSKLDYFNLNLFKKDEINEESLSLSNNSNLSKEKRIYLFLKKNFQNPLTPRSYDYSPQVSLRKRNNVFGYSYSEFSYLDSNDDNNFFSVSIDTTLHHGSRKENLIQNKNRVKGYKLDIKKNKDVPPNKSNNKIYFNRERYDYINKMMKASNSFAFKENEVSLNSERSSSNEIRLKNKNTAINKNKNESNKKKKSLRDYMAKKIKK